MYLTSEQGGYGMKHSYAILKILEIHATSQ